MPSDLVVCIDFETNCDLEVDFIVDVHEIVEFPAIAIDTKTNTIVGYILFKPTFTCYDNFLNKETFC